MRDKKYRVQYHCLLCGQNFARQPQAVVSDTDKHSFCDTAIRNLIRPMLNTGSIDSYVLHDCADGSVGIAVIAGVQTEV